MSERDAEWKAERPEQSRKVGDGIAESTAAARQTDAACDEHTRDQIPVTLEKVLSRENMWRAYERVVSNAGASGVDGIMVEALKPLLQARWEAIRKQLLGGTYQPSPVRKVEIPKPGRSRRYSRTSCSMSWTRSWSGAGIASSATPTTATFMFAAAGVASACWHRSSGSCRTDCV